MTILSVIPENPLLWAFLMQNFNLGIAKMSVIPENQLFPNPVLPKTSVLYWIFGKNGHFSESQIEIFHLKRPKLRISGDYGQNGHPQLIRYFPKPLYLKTISIKSNVCVQ